MPEAVKPAPENFSSDADRTTGFTIYRPRGGIPWEGDRLDIKANPLLAFFNDTGVLMTENLTGVPMLDDVDRFREQRRRETPDIDTESMAILGRIYRISSRMAPHIEAVFARHGLDRGEFDVLGSLQRSGPPYLLSPTELYRSLMISSGGLTHRLKRLEKAGMIRRIPSEQDGRSLMVQLTDEGYRRARAAFVDDMALENGWLESLSREERDQLAALLRKLGQAVPVHGESASDN